MLVAQVSHFEAERATWQDAERNLKSRITQLANKSSSVEPQSKSRPVTPLPEESEVAPEPTPTKPESKSALIKPAESAAPAPINPNPELVAELAQLTADFEALQSQHAQLADKHSEEISQLHAANHKLQDEAESFQLLLGERTLSGEILGQGVFGQSWDAPASFRSAINSRNSTDFARQKSPRLEGVIEEDEVLEGHGDGDQHSGAMGVNGVERRKNKGGGRPKAPTAGLDLAAELDRAAEHEQTSQDVDRDPSNDPYAEWPEERE